MLALGTAVVALWEGSHHIGEVVGVEESFQGMLYDVSLESVVIKALPEQETKPATAEAVRALLMALVGKATPGATLRQALLRQRYVAFLTRALAEFESGIEEGAAGTTRFAVGERVKVREDDAFLLGTVRGIAHAKDEVLYDVEIMGERNRMGEECLEALVERETDAAFGLGERVRFLTSGYEDDDAFLGVVCAMSIEEDAWVYNIEFDDGDVLEGLAAQDLARAQ